MYSMTGFGHAEGSFGDIQVSMDVKSVNSRYLDFKLHLGREWLELEPLMKKEIEARLARGRVDVFADIQSTSPDLLVLNEGIARSYLAAAEKLKDWGVDGDLDVASVFGLPGVLGRGATSVEAVREPVLLTLREALGALLQARGQEGRALETDITDRLANFASLVEVIESAAGRIRQYYEERLRKQIDRLSAEFQFDETRLAQEIVYHVERSDVSEELRRLQSHIQRFRSYLRESAGPLGKNLDFLCQEMNREVNTVLAKSALVDLTDAAVEAKAEMERIREQVQNVE
ncbi:MAG: YicC family protein [Acidobacteriota bacterium]|jgi:uncharacterized protein (TIGR00255 family)